MDETVDLYNTEMKLKCLAQDFQVTEIAQHKILSKAEHKLYLLTKTNLDTFAMLRTIAATQHIPASKIGIAGIKDKLAITTQYLTVSSEYDLHNGTNFTVQLLGYVQKKLKAGDLESNKFNITLRDLKKQQIGAIIERSKDLSVPNYFDSQRFGSNTYNEFLIKQVMQGKYTIHKFKYLPLKVREMSIFAYQSYLWNECIKELIQRTSQKHFSVAYSLGKLLFWYSTPIEIPAKFPLLAPNVKLNDIQQAIVSTVLNQEKITLQDLDILATGHFFKVYSREIILRPAQLQISKPEVDQLHRDRYKISLMFELPPGSYATIIIKRLQ